MATNILTKIFGSRNDRLLKQYKAGVARINAMEVELEKLSDDELRGKTLKFKERVSNGESLDSLLPEAFHEDASFRCPVIGWHVAA
jgi:preprotein translocase subunit SecA